MKICTKCNLTKTLSEFYKETKKPDGLQNHCKVCDNARKAIWKKTNPELSKLHMKTADINRNIKHKTKRTALRKKWKLANKDKVMALDAKRRAAKLQRIPKWLTDVDKLRIQCKYSVAAMLNKYGVEVWHVDHIIPLQGKYVSGLHVPENLRVIPAKINLSKSNSFEII